MGGPGFPVLTKITILSAFVTQDTHPYLQWKLLTFITEDTMKWKQMHSKTNSEFVNNKERRCNPLQKDKTKPNKRKQCILPPIKDIRVRSSTCDTPKGSLLVIFVTHDWTSGVLELSERTADTAFSKVNLEREIDLWTVRVERIDWAANTHDTVIRDVLPKSPETIDIGVVKVEDWV